EAVILATGSKSRAMAGVEGGQSVRDWDAQRTEARSDAIAVLFDMDHSAATYAVADAMAARYQKLVLLTPRPQIARNVNYCSAIGVNRRLYQAGAEIMVAVEPVAFANGLPTWPNLVSGPRG